MSTKLISWHGLPAVYLQNDDAEVVVTLHGAHVVSYIPAGGSEVLFVSKCSEFVDGKAIRGGVPVCFPWFGAPPQGENRAHGLVRYSSWKLLEADKTGAVFGMTVKNFRLRYTVQAAETLKLSLHIENISDADQSFTGALHTYFKVADVASVALDGLENAGYFDSLTGKFQIQTAPLLINCETDRIYKSSAAVTLDDPVLKRRITVEKSGSASTVVWNPWSRKSQKMADFGDEEYTEMLCIEAANAAAVNDTKMLKSGGCAALEQMISAENY